LPQCKWRIAKIDVFNNMSRYSAEYYEDYRQACASHWWFRGREAVLRAFVSKVADLASGNHAVFDIGSGPGGPTAAVFPGRRITAVDLDLETLQAYVPADTRIVADGSRLPLQRGSVGVLCAFDVLEHLEDDAEALRHWREVLAPGGWLVITVPAYESLWSSHDDVNGHHRRYRARILRKRLEETGFSVLTLTYFNTFLLPAIALARFYQRLRGDKSVANGDPGHVETDFSRRLPAPIEQCFEKFFSWESHIVRRWNLPAGVSLGVIARPCAERA
jgi:SAM-dependent methyltransferase